MNRSLAFTGLPLLLLTSAMAACSSAPGSSSTPPSTVSTTTSLAVGECASETAPASSGGDLDDKMTADGSCRARGLTLGSFGVSGGTASYACCKTEPTPIETDGGTIASDAGTSPPGTECEVDSLGSPTSSADPGTWKDDATKTCELRGETLSDFSVADPTGNGDYRFAKITCCEVAPPPPVCGCPVLEPGTTTTISNGSNITTAPAPLPPVDLDGGVAPPPTDAGPVPPICSCPVPPPQLCSGGGFGNAKGYCTATADAFKQAQNDCAQQGLQLTDFEPDQGSCAPGSVQGASYECCATIVTPPPPPPPPVCNGGGGFANANGTCSSLADAQAQAKAACAAEGETVQDFETTQGSCPAGEIQSGSYECCSTEVVGPPIEVDAGAPVPTPAPKPISN